MRVTFHFQSLGILAALFAMVVILTLASPHFLTTENIFSVIRRFSFVAIMATGEILTIITGGIDLSVGSVLGLCSCLTALCLQAGHSVPSGIAIGLFSGSLIGFLNGQLITRLRLPPFIVTLGMLSMARGLAYVISKGWLISGMPESYLRLGQGYLWVIPLPVVVMAAFAVIAVVFLERSVVGRQLYAIGGNETAFRLIESRKLRIPFPVLPPPWREFCWWRDWVLRSPLAVRDMNWMPLPLRSLAAPA